MIDDYINELCNILNISVPIISYNTGNFPTKTTMAQCDPTGKTIFIRKKNKSDPDCLFAIAHELRHIWQFKNNKDYYFSDYKTVDKIGTEKYNNQIAEVDAHAFASIVMTEFFHLQPLYHGLSEYTICLIKSHINIIKQYL